MKNLTIAIKDQQQLEQIEKLRGDKKADEFVRGLIAAGLAYGVSRQDALRFVAAKPEFKTLGITAITAALKENSPENPVHTEVSRLVKDYTTRLGELAKRNGNKLPAKLRVNASSPIEKVAFQITAGVMKEIGERTKQV